MSPLLALRGVSVRRGATLALDDVTLEVAEGEVLALLGPSGSGKSTLLRVLLGLDAPASGTVTLRGRHVSDGARILVPPEARDLTVVFQDLALWPHLTVAGQLRFVLRARRSTRDRSRTTPPAETRPASEPAEPALLGAMLQRVGLEALAERYPAELSGGERQRAAIARALITRPSAVLLDEPLGHLDLDLQEELLDLLAELFRERATTAIYVTHDPREAARLATRVAVLEAGRLVHDGSFDTLPRRGSRFLAAVGRALDAGTPSSPPTPPSPSARR